MKQYALYMLALGMVAPVFADNKNDSCDTDITGRSYLSVPGHFTLSAPEKAGFRTDRIHAREDGWHAALQATVFGSRSTRSENQARYFLPFGKTSLVASEDFREFAGGPNADTDILAANFNIFTVNGVDGDGTTPSFKSIIAIKPRQTVVGLGLQYRQSIWRNEERGRGVWFDISLPIVHIKNELNLTEALAEDGDGGGVSAATVTGVGDGPVANMKEAFKQKGFKFGKIDDDADDMKRTRVADIEVKFGYEWLDREPCKVETFLGLVIPTGNAPKAEYVYEAIVGNGKHVGITFGNNLGVQLWSNEEGDRSLRIEIANQSQYLFKKEHKRSLDLKNKPWSRYLSMYASAEDAQAAATANDIFGFTPGINILTLDVDVTPGFSHNANCAFLFEGRSFYAQAGYSLLSRRAECVELANGFASAPALKSQFGLGQTNPLREITGNIGIETAETNINAFGSLPVSAANYAQSIITIDDLDFASASTPCMLAHTLYADLGYCWSERKYPICMDVGGSYTFSSSNNAVVDRWTIWAKFGISL